MRDDAGVLGVSAVLFVASAAATVAMCASMSGMGMPMPGGWEMSMTWMKPADRTWAGAAASFVGMWTVMMAAMMLPSLVPTLRRYRATSGAGGGRTTIVGAGYFLVWAAVGAAVFPLGVALAEAEMRRPSLARVVPFAVGAAVVVAGALQFTSWKARRLACCRMAPEAGVSALRHGLRLGVRCVHCCAGLTAVLLVVGVMDLVAMGLVTAAITAERLAPAGERVARYVGAIVVGAGVLLIARAGGSG